ncbi:MAG: RHS repeat protein [Alphaproteobacteria bacterium]|nr:RHS repeat protein [Alphaproteobacteria bacterium]MCB9795708.1 RHS repeat protein [Alphaproteobacteria bacterium]
MLRRGRELMWVDPSTGHLHVEAVDLSLPGQGGALEVRRVHDGVAWRSSLDERLEISDSGLRWVGLERSLDLPADQRPMAERDEGPRWREGATFGGGVVTRTAEGFIGQDGARRSTFDEQGRLVRCDNGEGLRWTVEREPEGPTGLRTEDGRALRVLRDGEGRWSGVTGPGGQQLWYHRYGGELIAVSGSERARTRYVDDDDGRLAAILWPDGSRARVTYNGAGQVSAIAGPGTRLLRFEWREDGVDVRDGAGRAWSVRFEDDAVQVRDGAGRQSRVRYEAGRLIAWTDPRGLETRLQRDEAGDLVGIDGPGAEDWRLQRSQGLIQAITDPAGGAWRVDRDAEGRVVRITDPDGFAWAFAWTPAGALRAITRGQSSPTRFERDPEGRLTAIVHPGGATTRLRRDGRGRVTAVTDPAGNELLLTAWSGGMPGTVLSRGGARWTLTADSMGRLRRLETPYDQALELDRDASGRVTRLGAPQGGPGTRLRWRADGLINRMEDARGGVWGAVYDSAGRPIRVLRPDGSLLGLRWDPRGELIGLDLGDSQLDLRRDARGAPTTLGPLSWGWDLLGRLARVATEAFSLELLRTGAGRLSELRVQGEEEPLRISRDGAGRVSLVEQGDARWTLQRDPGGLIVGVQPPEGGALRIERDERGLPLIFTDAGAQRRVLRDASGRPLKWVAADGRALSADRGLVGEPRLVRFPDGSLTLTSWPEGPDAASGQRTWERVFEDPGGRAALDLRAGLGPDGRADVVLEGLSRWTWHRDAFGRATALEGEQGAWTRTPGAFAGPDGSLINTDLNDRPVEAIPPVGPPAWGVGEDTLQYLLGERGQIDAVLGETGRVTVRYDPLGRLQEVHGPDGAWAVRWDPFGRPSHVTDPEGLTTELRWGLDRLMAWETDGARTEVLDEPGWGRALLTGADALSLHVDAADAPRLAVRGEQAETLRWSPSGQPLHELPLTFSWRGLWSLFPAGPLLDGGGGWDPVSGRPTQAAWRPPVAPGEPAPGAHPQPIPSLDTSATPTWDPAPWRARSPFADPLSLLVALGELDPLLGGDWTPLPPDPAPLPWLPQAAATPEPPLTPALTGLPDALDPITRVALLAGLRGGPPLEEEVLLRALLEAELGDQTVLDWWGDPAPQGLLSPRWDPRGSQTQQTEFY